MFRIATDKTAPLLLVALLFALLVLMSAQVRRGGASLLEVYLLRVASPVVSGVSGGTATLSEGWHRYVDLRGAREESRRLEAELNRLRLERSRMAAVVEENDRLRRLVGLQARVEVPSLAADILANSSLGPDRTLLLGRGARDGVRENLPVVAAGGIVGRVVAVTERISKVQLITDAGGGAAVSISRTGLQGLLAGRGASLLRLRYIPLLEDVRPGDRLVTSGLDRIYPPGYPAGVVVRTGKGTGTMKEIDVAPAVDTSRLQEVLILLTPPQDDAGPDAPAAAPGVP